MERLDNLSKRMFQADEVEALIKLVQDIDDVIQYGENNKRLAAIGTLLEEYSPDD